MIRYSIETLYHFLCAECQMWWSIGDFEKQTVRCPYCGHKSLPVEMKAQSKEDKEK